MHEYLLVFLYIFACNVSDFFRESARKNIGCFERSETVCTVQYVLTPMHARDLIYAPQNSHKFTKERRGVKKSLRPLPHKDRIYYPATRNKNILTPTCMREMPVLSCFLPLRSIPPPVWWRLTSTDWIQLRISVPHIIMRVFPTCRREILLGDYRSLPSLILNWFRKENMKMTDVFSLSILFRRSSTMKEAVPTNSPGAGAEIPG